MGIKVNQIAKNKETKSKSTKFWEKELTIGAKAFSNRAKEDFYAELSILLNSGVNLKTALDLIVDVQKKKRDQFVTQQIAENILQGDALYEALEKVKHFGPYEVNAIKIGEESGKLANVADNLREYFQRKNQLRRQLISSLSYPVLVLFLAVAVVIFMLQFVVPMFVDIFKQNKVELPWITQQIVKVSDFFTSYGWWLLLLVFLLVFIVNRSSKSDFFYRWSGKLQLKIPVLGNYFKKIHLVQFTQAMALLTHAKIPVVQAIGMVRDMIRFYPLQKTLKNIEDDVVLGKKLHESFGKHSFYDKKMLALLKVAEETHQTEYIFQKLYDQYKNEMEYQGKLILNVFNFLLTMLVGIIVGVILVAMYLPMFKLSSIIG